MATSILYVDDETDLELLIRSRYEREIDAGALACDFAHSGAEALALIDGRPEPYELIVVDIAIPGMSGLELLDALAKRKIETPVIVMSGYHDMANIRAAMNRGAFDFLPKPADLEDLELTQQKALRQFETLRRARIVERAYARPELAALGLLVAGIAHDLKNPLAFVLSFTKLALEMLGEFAEEIGSCCESELAEDLQSDLESIEQTLGKVASHSEWALQLVGTLLASAAGGGPFDFNAAIARHVDLFESSVRAKFPKLDLVIHKHFDNAIGLVPLDPRIVVSVVINLLENATHALRDHTAPGDTFKPEIRVETRVLDGAIELSVSDNGPGVPAKLRERIFQPFFTTKAAGEGTGLGLHIVERLATEAGGNVVLEDHSPIGACFRVRFPR